MKFTKLILAAVCAISTASSFAQAKDESGFYGIGAFGTSSVKGTITSSSGTPGNATTQGNGWQIGLGYDINKDFAVEGTYGQFFKSVSNAYVPAYSYTNNSTTNASGFSFTALGKKQVSENVRLFAGPSVMIGTVSMSQYELSGGTTTARNDSKSFNPFGVVLGASFALDSKTDLRLSYATNSLGITQQRPTVALIRNPTRFHRSTLA
jgi:opacity protein-like surface antigen